MLNKPVALAGGGASIGFLAGTGLKPGDITLAAEWMLKLMSSPGAGFVSLVFNILQGVVLYCALVYFWKKDDEKRADAKEAFAQALSFGREIHATIDKHVAALYEFRLAIAQRGMDRTSTAAGGLQGSTSTGTG